MSTGLAIVLNPGHPSKKARKKRKKKTAAQGPKTEKKTAAEVPKTQVTTHALSVLLVIAKLYTGIIPGRHNLQL